MRRTAEDSAEVIELLCQSVTPGSRGVDVIVSAVDRVEDLAQWA